MLIVIKNSYRETGTLNLDLYLILILCISGLIPMLSYIFNTSFLSLKKNEDLDLNNIKLIKFKILFV